MPLETGFEHFVRSGVPLAPLTWFHLGGPAEYLAEPTSVEELQSLVARCRDEAVSVRILGGGSNVLVRDEGVLGMTVRLSAPAFSDVKVDKNCLRAGGGAKLGHAISGAVRAGLSGLETLVGIPGTIGGALHGNAGSRGGDIGQRTDRATVLTRAGDLLTRSRGDLVFGYRESSLD
jgi:UDP-N-acetylmuramate dehydrogenase